jgi:large subunit ribosomal protein L24
MPSTKQKTEASKARGRSKQQGAPEVYKIKIKKDDQVKVIAGKDRGKTGRVISVDRKKGRVLVEGISMIKRHTRPNPQKQIKGGIAERESAIAVSNVMVLTSGGVPTRVGYRIEGTGAAARRVRVARKSGEPLDKKG